MRTLHSRLQSAAVLLAHVAPGNRLAALRAQCALDALLEHANGAERDAVTDTLLRERTASRGQAHAPGRNS